MLPVSRLHEEFEPATSELHEERLNAVVRQLLLSGAGTVADLGCGSGDLLLRLLPHPRFSRIFGIDTDVPALNSARRALGSSPDATSKRISVQYGSFEVFQPALSGFEAATMVETIEHIDPRRLSMVEHVVFGCMRPSTVLLTTPNQEYNRLLGLAPGEMRHVGHRFEWPRARFRQWVSGVAKRNRYTFRLIDVGTINSVHGGPTQMAIFSCANRI